MRPVGRITCSAKTPPVRCISQPPGVAETQTVCGRIASHSSKRKGRLSIAEGRRKPNSASVALRLKSPRNMPPDLRNGDMAFIDEDEGIVGQIFEQRRRRLAGLAAGEIARIILDAGAGAGRHHHLDVEEGALLEPLRFEHAACCVEFCRA